MSLVSLNDLGVALKRELVAKACPLEVLVGPEKAKTAVTYGAERVVLELDVDGKDTFAPPRGLHGNAKHRYTATDTFKATIYVTNRAAGPQPFEHLQRAKLAREAVIAALELVAAKNKNKFKPTSGGFVVPKDMAAAEQQNGAAYELKFTYSLPIRAVTFAGAARPEGTVTGFTSTTQVSQNHANPTTPPDDAETACGEP